MSHIVAQLLPSKLHYFTVEEFGHSKNPLLPEEGWPQQWPGWCEPTLGGGGLGWDDANLYWVKMGSHHLLLSPPLRGGDWSPSILRSLF